MKKKLSLMVLLSLLFFLSLVLFAGCLSESDFPTFTCKYCGKGGLSETEYKSSHEVKACVAQAPCGTDGHYVLTGKSVDNNGVDHSAKCTLCEGFLCTGEHGEGKCVQKTSEPSSSPSESPSEKPQSSDTALNELNLNVVSGNNDQTQVGLSVRESTQTVQETYHAGDVISIDAITKDKKAVVSGSSSMTLSEGDNTFTFDVIAEDGVTKKTYAVTVHAEPPLSDECSLKTFVLILPNGTQIDMRDPIARKNITVTDVRNATVTAAAKNSKAKVSGDKGNISIVEGENSYRVKVTAENGKTASFEYRILMKKKPAIPPRSSDAMLKSLSLELPDVGSLAFTPAFSPDVYEYHAETDGNSITITGTANHPGATVTGGGSSLDLSHGENVIDIVVTAENGVTKKTYSVYINVSRSK